MVFKNVSDSIRESYFDLHYHADFVELNALSKGELGLDFDGIKALYPSKEDAFVNDIFAMLSERASSYNEDYPFVITYSQRIESKSDINNRNKLYIFLLFCSYTNKIECTSNLLQSDFEYISRIALEEYLPEDSVVNLMGKSSARGQVYTGSITNKLDQIAGDLRCSTIYQPDYFAPTNNGDGGLDVIAWIPMQGDEYYHYNMQVFIGQCATGKDWTGKQQEPEKMLNYLLLPKATTTIMFIPYDGRKADGDFQHKAIIRVPVLFDRRRIMHLIQDLDDVLTLVSFTDVISRVNVATPDLLG